MPQQDQSIQQGQEQQQQQQGIFGSHPGLTHDHGSELPNKKPDLDELTPPGQDFFPGNHSGAIQG